MYEELIISVLPIQKLAKIIKKETLHFLEEVNSLSMEEAQENNLTL